MIDLRPRLAQAFAACLVTLLAASPAAAQLFDGAPIEVSARWDQAQARPGDARVLAVVLDIPSPWHINPDAAQLDSDFLIPTEVTVQVDDGSGLAVGPVQYPEPHLIEFALMPGEKVPAYEGQTVIYVPVMVGPDAEPGTVPVTVTVAYQPCDDKNCLFPTDESIELELEVVPAGTTIEQGASDTELFADFDTTAFARMAGGGEGDAGVSGRPVGAASDDASGAAVVPQVVDFYFFQLDPRGVVGLTALFAVAAFGGMLLNFTPCVLPVIPIKMIGLAQAAGDRRKCLFLGAVMSLGVVAFWLGIGVVIATISGFTASNQLFQYPLFTIGVGVIIAIMGIAMGGLFTVQLPRWVYAVNPKHDSVVGSFGFGIMTAVLSTPCTAPFMGAAAAWAATQSPTITLSTFAAVGLGMALPYLVLSANPRLVERLPRTGPGSELLKQVMGLLILAAAAYFVGVGVVALTSDGTREPSQLYWWGPALFIAAAGAWLAYRTFRITRETTPRAVFGGAGLVVVALALIGGVAATSGDSSGDGSGVRWTYYTPERFDQALAEGHVVVLDFTAEWCLNCKALEATVLSQDAVVEALNDPRVRAMKVDLTGGNAAGRAKLAEAGRVMIPLLVVYGPDGREVFKADAYTPDQVLRAVEAARQGPVASRDRG